MPITSAGRVPRGPAGAPAASSAVSMTSSSALDNTHDDFARQFSMWGAAHHAGAPHRHIAGATGGLWRAPSALSPGGRGGASPGAHGTAPSPGPQMAVRAISLSPLRWPCGPSLSALVHRGAVDDRPLHRCAGSSATFNLFLQQRFGRIGASTTTNRNRRLPCGKRGKKETAGSNAAETAGRRWRTALGVLKT